MKVLAGFNLPLIYGSFTVGEAISGEDIDQTIRQAKGQMIFMNSVMKQENS